MATVEKRGKSYRITASAGYSLDGKQVRQRMTWAPEPNMTPHQIERELQRQKIMFENSVESGQYVNAKNIKLAEFCKEYLEMTESALSPTTWRSYQRTIELRINPALGHIKLSDLRPLHVQRFIKQLEEPGKVIDKNARYKKGKHEAESKCLSPATVKRIHAVLQSILGRAVRLGLIEVNPADSAKIDLPHTELPEVQILDEDAAVAVLDALGTEPLKYQVLIHLALCLGCRRGELIALHWSNIDFEKGMVRIERSAYKLTGTPEKLKDPKNRSSIRTLTIPEYCCKLLTTYHAEQTAERIKLGTLWQDGDFIFTQWNGKEMNPDTASKWFSAFLKRHNLPHVKFHALRHSSATLALQDGANIKAVAAHLGHSQLSTVNRYIHALGSADKALAEGFEKRFGQKATQQKCGQA